MGVEKIKAKSALWAILWQHKRNEMDRADELVKEAKKDAEEHVALAKRYADRIKESAKAAYSLMKQLRRKLGREGDGGLELFLNLIEQVPGKVSKEVKCERATLEVYGLMEKWGYNAVEAVTHLTRRYTLGGNMGEGKPKTQEEIERRINKGIINQRGKLY